MAANNELLVLRSNKAACAASAIRRARAASSSLHASSSREQRRRVSRAAFSCGAFAANSRLPALYDDASAVSAGLTRGHAVVWKLPANRIVYLKFAPWKQEMMPAPASSFVLCGSSTRQARVTASSQRWKAPRAPPSISAHEISPSPSSSSNVTIRFRALAAILAAIAFASSKVSLPSASASRSCFITVFSSSAAMSVDAYDRARLALLVAVGEPLLALLLRRSETIVIPVWGKSTR
mmetsp:Transcript_25524/g.71797  ORF Transcript_25524/g.71797 Transcript_25524/m.71797 type:complete len:237 (-) Transcript_25524:63-773(-)